MNTRNRSPQGRNTWRKQPTTLSEKQQAELVSSTDKVIELSNQGTSLLNNIGAFFRGVEFSPKWVLLSQIFLPLHLAISILQVFWELISVALFSPKDAPTSAKAGRVGFIVALLVLSIIAYVMPAIAMIISLVSVGLLMVREFVGAVIAIYNHVKGSDAVAYERELKAFTADLDNSTISLEALNTRREKLLRLHRATNANLLSVFDRSSGLFVYAGSIAAAVMFFFPPLIPVASALVIGISLYCLGYWLLIRPFAAERPLERNSLKFDNDLQNAISEINNIHRTVAHPNAPTTPVGPTKTVGESLGLQNKNNYEEQFVRDEGAAVESKKPEEANVEESDVLITRWLGLSRFSEHYVDQLHSGKHQESKKPEVSTSPIPVDVNPSPQRPTLERSASAPPITSTQESDDEDAPILKKSASTPAITTTKMSDDDEDAPMLKKSASTSAIKNEDEDREGEGEGQKPADDDDREGETHAPK